MVKLPLFLMLALMQLCTAVHADPFKKADTLIAETLSHWDEENVPQTRMAIAADHVIEALITWRADGTLTYPPEPLHISENAIIADIAQLNALRSRSNSITWASALGAETSLYRCEPLRCVRVNRQALARVLDIAPSLLNPNDRTLPTYLLIGGLVAVQLLVAAGFVFVMRRKKDEIAKVRDPNEFAFGPVTVCPGLMTVVDDLGTRNITQRDIAILKHLHNRQTFVVSKDELYDVGWGRDYFPSSRALDQHITALRRKLDPKRLADDVIETVHGQGYRYSG
ncbi:MAG: winged helix-turn-helix domain-containing protein [Pseudomonadota bacterium]